MYKGSENLQLVLKLLIVCWNSVKDIPIFIFSLYKPDKKVYKPQRY
jgi:hypothetical protein